MADFLTFDDLRDEVSRFIKDFGQSKVNMVDATINMVYFEMLAADTLFPMFWLVDFDDTLGCVGPRTMSALTAADPGVATVDAAHGLTANVDLVSVYNIVGTTVLNNRAYLVNTTPLSTTLSFIDIDSDDAIDTTLLTAYSSLGSIVHRGKVLGVTGKDVQRILKVRWHGDGAPLKEITPAELEAETKWWDPATSRPTRYMHRKKYSSAGVESNQLLWFPGSDGAYDLRYWFERRPAKLSGNTDVPQMPPVFHYGIVTGSLARLAEVNAQVENAVIWPGLYRQTLNQLLAFNRKYWKDHDPTRDASRTGKPYML